MRQRAGALIISNKKLLLINEGEQGFYWTPGGGVEKNETFEQTLKRELEEELGSKVETEKRFFQMVDQNEDEEVVYFLIKKYSKINQHPDTKLLWYDRDMYIKDKVRISKRVHKHIIPKLISEGYL